MKCLAVGMNPNYVLSEDQRKKRFKNRTDSSCKDILTEISSVHASTYSTPPVYSGATAASTSSVFRSAGQPQPIQNIRVGPNPFSASHQHNCQAGQQPTRGQIIMKNENYIKSGPCSFEQNINIKKEVVTESNMFPETKYVFQPFESQNKNLNQNLCYFDGQNKKPTQKSLIADASQELLQEDEYYDTSDGEIEEDRKLIQLGKEPEIKFSEDEKQMLDNLVRDHDNIYYSVNIGEVLIKEMLMCSMFGVQVNVKTKKTFIYICIFR